MQAGWMPASTPADTTGRYDACNLFLLPPIFFLPLDQLPLISWRRRRGAPRDPGYTRRCFGVFVATDSLFSRFSPLPPFPFPKLEIPIITPRLVERIERDDRSSSPSFSFSFFLVVKSNELRLPSLRKRDETRRDEERNQSLLWGYPDPNRGYI